MRRNVSTLAKLNSNRASAVVVLFATTALALPAQTFTTLYSFAGGDGQYPNGLLQGTNGYLYGTTSLGGSNCAVTGGCGTIFKITPIRPLKTLYNFDSTSGADSGTALVQATNGDFYGTTQSGGANSGGTVFKTTASGTLTTLYSFCSPNGYRCLNGGAYANGLIQATDGDLYGTTSQGGAKCVHLGGCGTVFRITPGGTFKMLYSFCSQSACTDGSYPLGELLQGITGDFYGTTPNGGANGYGTVFRISPSGVLTTLYSFCSEMVGFACTDGASPYAGLIQGSDGNFYGTTYGGGANDASNNGGGTVFRISPTGALTTLYSFCSQGGDQCTDGYILVAGLVQATDGNFYGTTLTGGANCGSTGGCGTLFRLDPTGALTTLYNFCSQAGCTDGAYPVSTLIQATNGSFYGTTQDGGTNCPSSGGCGTVFGMSVGLGPFVEALPNSGKIGQAVKILGTGLTGATNVSFNGTAAVFKVPSGSEITTAVPAGATTGPIQVVTPNGTLLSNVPFQVR